MKKFLSPFLLISLFCSPSVLAQKAAGDALSENRYDVIGKMFAPFVNILLTDTKNPNHAALLTIVFEEVTGRLPKQFKGATLSAAVEYPDKVKLDAPVLGERMIVCRNGDQVWGIPGEKIEFLLKQFKIPTDSSKKVKITTPIDIPITAQQAVFLPALFVIQDAGFEEVTREKCRVLEGGLMPDLAKAVKAEAFTAKVWITAAYLPKKIEVRRKDFSAIVAITDLRFGPSLTKATWEPPAGVTDIYHTDAGQLQKLLYVVMNSLQIRQADASLLNPK